MPTEILTALISSVIGGGLVAVVNFLFVRKRTEAETEKLKAETDKIRAEAERIRLEARKFSDAVEESNYIQSTSSEIVIFDGTKNIEGYDFEVVDYFSRRYFHLDSKTLCFHTNDSRVKLCKYLHNGKELEYLPKSKQSGIRKFRVSYEARVTLGRWAVHISLSSRLRDEIFQSRDMSLDGQPEKIEWKQINFYYRFPADEDVILKIGASPLSNLQIDNEELRKESLEISKQGQLQIRNLVFAESPSQE